MFACAASERLGRAGVLPFSTHDFANTTRFFDQASFKIFHVRFIEIIGSRSDQNCGAPPIPFGVVITDAVADVFAFANVDAGLAILVPDQQIDAGVAGFCTLKRRSDLCPRSHQHMTGPVEDLGCQHPVRLAVDEVELERASFRPNTHSAASLGVVSPASRSIAISTFSGVAGGSSLAGCWWLAVDATASERACQTEMASMRGARPRPWSGGWWPWRWCSPRGGC